ncbi:hypothetical protein ILUMI_24044 [Ignelater luminosus]|uniref:PiggyBac transposable element-derived protein domain-containing protein n=1 Tax=Ignelater luminosus TaxID=2038154 RepID=A0A8K0CBA9_IGNLU|nr:hypothetical protein ILUMI_24044 [Ignelater luminosus]
MSSLEGGSSASLLDNSVSNAKIWCPISTTISPLPLPRFQFTNVPSISFNINNEATVLDFVELFLDQNLRKIVLDETNRFVENKRDSKWIWLTDDELMVFFATNILMLIIKKPTMPQYWSKKKIIITLIFKRIIDRKQFLLIKKYMHFYEDTNFNASTHPNAKLYKILSIDSYLNEKFQSLYTPDEDVTIDESLMLFKGRLGWKQYIPLKKAKFGIKSYMLCESKSSYVWNFVIYMGKGTQYDPNYVSYSCSTKIVTTLLKLLLGKEYCLTTDNFYMSPELADILIQHKTGNYGTVRANRKDMPNELKKKN